MSSMWKSLKSTMDKVLKKAGEITKEAADKAEEVTKLGKVKLEIFQIKKDIERKEAELGHIVYDSIKGSENKKSIKVDKNTEKIVKEIDELRRKLEEKEVEYNKIKIEDDNTKDIDKPVE
ncbi:MAG: hypothetical protein H0Z29_00620 [Candidatus Marinimicrobia bacterium]|nr:hypothetical protein [Candidatus Neomarinimicrobiota bacterium]